MKKLTLSQNRIEESAGYQFLRVTAAYLGIALVMTYPLMNVFGSYAAGGAEDGAMGVWGLWWVKHSLVDLGQNPLDCQYLFFPGGINLTYTTLPKILALFSIPFQYIFGLTAASNLIFLLMFVGTGVATYYLVLHLTGEKLPAFLAGAFFAFSPFRWGQMSHLWFMSTMLVPVYILMLIRGREALQTGSRRAWLFFASAGLVLGIQSYDTEHYTIALLLFSAIYLIFSLFCCEDRDSLKKWLKLLLGQVLATTIAAMLYLPMLLAARAEIAEHGNYVTFPLREIEAGADLLSFLVPSWVSWYLADPFDSVASRFLPTETSFVGWTVVLLAFMGVWRMHRNRQVWLWLSSVIVFSSLALGPYLIVNGEMSDTPLPFLLLQKIPLLNSTRVPVRLTMLAMLSLSVLAGYGMSSMMPVLRKLKWSNLAIPAATLAVLTLLFIEYRPNFAMFSMESPKIYEEIAASDIPGSVIDLPLGWEATPHGAGSEMTFVELYQPVHQRPLVGGMVGRAPKSKSLRSAYEPVIDYLAEPNTYDSSELDRDPAAIQRVIDEYQIAFIVIHKNHTDYFSAGKFNPRPALLRDPELLAKLDTYIRNDLRIEYVAETDDYVAYRRRK